MSQSKILCGKALIKELKQMERELREYPLLHENRLFERELTGLIKTAKEQYFTLIDDKMLLGEEVISLEDISDKTVSELIERLSHIYYIGEADINSLLWQGKVCLIRKGLKEQRSKSGKSNANALYEKMYQLRDLDMEELSKLSPLHAAFLSDELYDISSWDTKAMFRAKAALVARETGIGEEKYIPQLLKRADNDKLSICRIIETDYRNVFPYLSVKRYILTTVLISAVISAALGFLSHLWLIPIIFFPVFGTVKPFVDFFFSRGAKSNPLPRIKDEEALGKGNKVLCVISALVNDEKGIEEALYRLKNAKLKNTEEGISFALLLDLPAKDKEKDSSDKLLFSASEKLRQRIFPKCTVFFRKRSYCKTMEKWQGYERKRGAIEQLAKYICGESADFAFVSGNGGAARECGFIAALDLDTVPLMDSIKELAAAALHPLNKDYAIIAPRCTSTLDSTLKTPFAGIMAGNGGACCISSYDSFGGEFYFDGFGEGIFCGKGLIRAREFLDRCKNKLPEERVLSHDILEGGFCGVAYCGDVEFSDSFPSSSKAYFKRAHRWIRGDFQNMRFIFKKEFSPLTKFKLFDNFRRGVSPALVFALFFISCFVRGGIWCGLTAYLSLLLPFLPSLFGSVKRGFAFGITRRFYSPIVSETVQLLLKCLMELMTLPKAALVSLDAGIKTLWRGIISKKKLLEWTTSGFLEKTAFKGNVFSLLPAFFASLALLACSIIGEPYAFWGALPMCAAFPFFVYADKPKRSVKPVLSKKAQKELLSQAEKMWSFFTEYTGQDTCFLPPDNVQLSPVFRVCGRTSPTNIGMYLLAAAAVFSLGIIDRKSFLKTVENAVETVERLDKWEGNLYNWYQLNTLEVLGGFVSSVDSGNFLACLIAVKECLKINNISPSLTARCEKLINETDLSKFYCKKKRLFSIGYDTETNKLSSHRYDMLMSEARLLSYTAIALGQVPKKHWRALSRTMSRNGRYAGAIAWTGTMFEYYMPELLLTSKEGSMSYEALRYSFYCQKQRSRQGRKADSRQLPFGISESGYYAFDKELNYQYKAHGVQKTALKGGMDREYVASPYSSYLTLSSHPLESWNNLAVFEKEGAFNPDYGFYEAVDYTKGRVGDRAIIKSFMAHHMGMSICGAANALSDNICSKLFLSDEKMKRAEELLEEKIMAGEKVLKITEKHYDNGGFSCEREIIACQKATGSPAGVFWSGQLALFASANGCFYSVYKGLSAVNKTSDWLNRPSGAFYGFCDGKNVYPFFAHPRFKNNLVTEFSPEKASYTVEEKELLMTMTVRASSNREIRSFSVKNRTKSKKQLSLCAYSEPVLAASRDYAAHPMFLDLFLRISYDEGDRLFYFYRKDRHSDKITACAAGFLEGEDFTYCLSREKCTDYRPFSFFKTAFERENTDQSIPDPCLLIRDSISLDSLEEKHCTLFYCYGDSREEVKKAAFELRAEGLSKKENDTAKKRKAAEKAARETAAISDTEEVSPLSLGTLQGRMAEKILPALLYGEISQEKILNAKRDNTLEKKELWRYGISGDLPLLVSEGTEGLDYIALLKSGLEGCGIECDLIVLCSDALERGQAESIMAGNGHALLLSETDKDTVTLIYSLAAYVNLEKLFSEKDDFEKGEKSKKDEKDAKEMKTALPILPCRHNDRENGFTENGFVIGEENRTWCNILANPEFGALMSQNSLGFTFALNSRENKLTPWHNDIIKDNYGEMLLLKAGGKYYDLIRGSRAEFSPYSCVYEGKALSVEAKTEVKVYTSETGKEISLTLTNTEDREQAFDLVYKIIPLMAAEKEGSAVSAFTLKDGAAFFNEIGGGFKGTMAVYCSKKPKFCFSPIDIAAGDFSELKGEGEHCYSPVTALVVPLKLPPRENMRIRFILGYQSAENPSEANQLFSEKAARSAQSAQLAIDYLKRIEGSPCGNEPANSIIINTPISSLNSLFNTWLPHQITACRIWSRTGFFQNGGAYGFRDQLQDCLAAMYFSPRTAKEHILHCCQSQFPEGDVLHWWHDIGGKRAGVRTRYSDDLLWLPYVACSFDEAFGEEGFWDIKVPYCKGGVLAEDKQELFMTAESTEFSESLYEHCKKAMEKGFNKGKRGLIKIGCGDWNDGYNNVGIKGKGESVWLAMFYIMCGKKFAAVAKEKDDNDYAEKLEKRIAELYVSVEENAWDGDWYLRAFYDNGDKMGGNDCSACQIDILPQAFSVLCELPDGDRCVTALNSAWDRLVDKKAGIIKLFTPPFTEEAAKEPMENKEGKTPIPSQRPGYVMSYPAGVRENGGQYTHGAVWYCLACFKAGQKERAFQLLNMLNPALKSDSGGEYRESYKKEKEKTLNSILNNITGEEREAAQGKSEAAQSEKSGLDAAYSYPDENFGREPYFMTADIYTNPQCYGKGGWSMYTGAASWYWKCIFEGLFGAKLKKGRLYFSPNLPKEFDGASMKLRLNGKNYNITFKYTDEKTSETAVGENGGETVIRF